MTLKTTKLTIESSEEGVDNSQNHFRAAFRVCCVAGLLLSSVTFNTYTVIFIILLVLSFAHSRFWQSPSTRSVKLTEFKPNNPFRKKLFHQESWLDDALETYCREYVQKDVQMLQDNESLQAFQVIKQNSQCIFAKKSKLWGNFGWNNELSFSNNIQKLVPQFSAFTSLCEKLQLDGFVICLPKEKCNSYKEFSKSVLETLTILAANDPNYNCMEDLKRLSKSDWVFMFNQETFFITTFAPYYSEKHSRYAYESEAGFILFQPELSFAKHELPPDTPHTNWDNNAEPVTVRDTIRRAFKEAGQMYHIRETVQYPMAMDIVQDGEPKTTENVCEWWADNN